MPVSELNTWPGSHSPRRYRHPQFGQVRHAYWSRRIAIDSAANCSLDIDPPACARRKAIFDNACSNTCIDTDSKFSTVVLSSEAKVTVAVAFAFAFAVALPAVAP